MLVSLFSFILLLNACKENDKIVASVDDLELKESEAFAIMDYLGLSPTDKSEFENFLQNWTEKKLYEVELKNTYPDAYQLIQLRADRYKSDLARYELEEITLYDKMDTAVTEQEIEAYYDQHKEEFVLTDYLVRALYLKIPKDADFKKKNIQQKYLLKNNKDLDEINSYAKLYAENYYFNDSAWVYFSDLTKDIPLKRFNKDNIVLNRTKTYFTEGEFTYFLNIFDFQLKDEVPTLDFLRDDIRNIVLNQRIQKEKEELSPKLLKELKNKYAVQINP